MDSEMYSDFAANQNRAWKKNFSLEASEVDEKGDDGTNSKTYQACEQILNKLEEFLKHMPHMESQFAFQVEKAVKPILDVLKEKEEIAEKEESADEDQEVREIIPAVEQLIVDVKSLQEEVTKKNQMTEPNPAAEVPGASQQDVDALALEVQELKEQLKDTVAGLEEKLAKVQDEVDAITSNVGNLFTFMYAKEKGKTVRLKGGWHQSTGRLLIHVSRPSAKPLSFTQAEPVP
jgi:hypothetical protein